MNKSIRRMVEGEKRLPLPLSKKLSPDDIARHLTLHPAKVRRVIELGTTTRAMYSQIANSTGLDRDTVAEILRLAGR